MITDYFKIEEVVCPHILSHYSIANGWLPLNNYGHFAWNFFDIRLLETEEILRKAIGKEILINNEEATQRGLRCVKCQLMIDVYKSGKLFTDPHSLGKGWDNSIKRMTGEESRQWVISHQYLFPYPIRLEIDVDWLHLDVMTNSIDKVTLFKK